MAGPKNFTTDERISRHSILPNAVFTLSPFRAAFGTGNLSKNILRIQPVSGMDYSKISNQKRLDQRQER